MSPVELLADTNRLLLELAEANAKSKAESEVLKKQVEEMRTSREDQKTDALGESAADWKARREAALKISQEKTRENLERERQFKDDLLAELRLQSELLQKIAEKLGL